MSNSIMSDYFPSNSNGMAASTSSRAIKKQKLSQLKDPVQNKALILCQTESSLCSGEEEDEEKEGRVGGGGKRGTVRKNKWKRVKMTKDEEKIEEQSEKNKQKRIKMTKANFFDKFFRSKTEDEEKIEEQSEKNERKRIKMTKANFFEKFRRSKTEISFQELLSDLLLDVNHMTDKLIKVPPPEFSSIYWKDDSGKKYKAFMSTDNSEVYYSIREYDAIDAHRYLSNVDSRDNLWELEYANYNVRLAVTKDNGLGSSIIKIMDYVKHTISKNVMEDYLRAFSQESNFQSGNELVHYQYTPECNEYYFITLYNVCDIKDVPLVERYKHKLMDVGIFVSPSRDQQLIKSIKSAVKKMALCFSNDSDYRVYTYGKKDNVN